MDREGREHWHGEDYGYTVYGCRGPKCKAAHALAARKYRAKIRASPDAKLPRGRPRKAGQTT